MVTGLMVLMSGEVAGGDERLKERVRRRESAIAEALLGKNVGLVKLKSKPSHR